jgi:hypothetical protein
MRGSVCKPGAAQELLQEYEELPAPPAPLLNGHIIMLYRLPRGTPNSAAKLLKERGYYPEYDTRHVKNVIERLKKKADKQKHLTSSKEKEIFVTLCKLPFNSDVVHRLQEPPPPVVEPSPLKTRALKKCSNCCSLNAALKHCIQE